MSQENVDTLRRGWKALSERGMDAVADEYYAEDCLAEDFPELPDGTTWVGRDGVRKRYSQFVEIWGDFVMEPIEFIDVDDDRVIAVAVLQGHGEGSGLPLDSPAAFVYDMRDGLIVRERPFMSRREALEAVGLRE